MKKAMCGVLATMLFVCGCTGDIDNEDNKKRNYLGGVGKIHYTEGPCSIGGSYDDENVYVADINHMYRYTKDGDFMINCDIATCSHDNTECKAATMSGEYFVFGGRLYHYYNESDIVDAEIKESGFIRDCETGEIVFTNTIPEGLDESKKLDKDTDIHYITIINEDYIKVEGHWHAYILDTDFDLVCWYGDVGKWHWGHLYEDKFYYINDLYEMSYIDMTNGKTGTMGWDHKILFGGGDGENLFYTDEFNDFYRYSLKDGTRTKIGEDSLFFSVYDGSIYCYQIIDEVRKKVIMDYDGNIKFDYTENIHMGFDNLLKMGDKLYNIIHDGGKVGIAMMNLDGTDYKEVYLE